MSVDRMQSGGSSPVSETCLDRGAKHPEPHPGGDDDRHSVSPPADREALPPSHGIGNPGVVSPGRSDGTSSAGLSSDRRHEIEGRLRSGFYDTTLVRRVIARRVRQDL